MEQVVPWDALVAVIRPYYPQGKTGRPPMPLEKMLRVYCLQQWYALSDPGMEDALYEIESMRRFAGFTLNEEAIPDESTILLFRHLLEKHGLTEQLFSVVNRLLESRGMIFRKGTIVDATIIHAPSSTKNAEGKRDPEMSSTKKGSNYSFGMKAHVGADSEYGLVHTLVCTTAKVHDSVPMEELLHGSEREIYGDRAYVSQERQAKYEAQGKRWRVQHKATKSKPLTEHQERQNQRRSRVRSAGEHLFGVVKYLWGHRKVRYRGLYKNACQLYSLFALGNLYLMRRPIMERPFFTTG
jgi:IS5 family transposase